MVREYKIKNNVVSGGNASWGEGSSGPECRCDFMPELQLIACMTAAVLERPHSRKEDLSKQLEQYCDRGPRGIATLLTPSLLESGLD